MQHVNKQAHRFLIWGKGGWVAGHIENLLKQQGKEVFTTGVRMQNQAEVRQTIEHIKPTHVINCAGKTGRPNVDWCESHKLETVRANVIGTLILADECEAKGTHLTVMATGCVYASQYSPDMARLESIALTELDIANFGGSFYSYTKSRVEDIMKFYPNCLILRLRMPVSDDLHARNFVTKIANYPKIVNIPNSNSILHDLLPMTIALAEHHETGVYNFTNPGAISHNEVMVLYRDIIDPSKKWENFTLEEQSKVIVAGRSNCELDSSKLMAKVKQYVGEGYQVDVPEIHDAYRQCFMRMKENMQQQPGAAT